ncbi:MAG: protease SohB [Gammaproteobacteria bacterium]
MIEFLAQYGLFLAKALTVVVAVAAIAIVIAVTARREKREAHLKVKHLNARYRELKETLEHELLSKKQIKAKLKARKKEDKAKAKASDRADTDTTQKRVFVLNFRGDIKASAVSGLREEITAVLGLAQSTDEVVVRLENPGGLVHEHGLAASQLMRLRERDVPLTVAVDKVAASGGYLMACVANRILAAPFAVLGSVGVLMQLPNLHRVLDAHGVDFEQIKGGEYKRTLTVFGKNTDADRAKAQADVEDTHLLFKDFVKAQRPQLDMERIATGEHWYGLRALELELCDRLTTSDDYLLEQSESAEVYEVTMEAPKHLSEKIAAAIQTGLDGLLGLWSERKQRDRYAMMP